MQWIVTDDIFSETWRRLLEFSNAELSIDHMIKIHGPPKSAKENSNYLKQAAQARVCVLQAKEYFDAAKSSSLYTSPNHAYYGCVALASLSMLILGNGENSLDYLRRDNKNNHHGLDFTTGCDANKAKKGISLLDESRACVLANGHFSNWYKVLPKTYPVSAVVTFARDNSNYMSREDVGTVPAKDLSWLIGHKRTLTELLKYLPDLNYELNRYGIEVMSSRSTHTLLRDKHGLESHSWALHSCPTLNIREKILEGFTVESRFSDAINLIETDGAGAFVNITYNRNNPANFSWPDARETLNHETIMYAQPLRNHEIVDLYMTAYQLSMLSRYFPDIWVGCIESQCKAAKLIELSVQLIIKKLPILTLSMLYQTEIVISTNRDGWK